MTFIISCGKKYGGFYVWHKGISKRLCLGWIAFTYVPMDDWWIYEAVKSWGQK
jgi:hypothetical protein